MSLTFLRCEFSVTNMKDGSFKHLIPFLPFSISQFFAVWRHFWCMMEQKITSKISSLEVKIIDNVTIWRVTSGTLLFQWLSKPTKTHERLPNVSQGSWFHEIDFPQIHDLTKVWKSRKLWNEPFRWSTLVQSHGSLLGFDVKEFPKFSSIFHAQFHFQNPRKSMRQSRPKMITVINR